MESSFVIRLQRLRCLTRRLASTCLALALTAGLAAAVRAEQTVGLFLDTPGSYESYTLFTPMGDTDTYLINREGKLVHSWASDLPAGLSVYLLPNGNLLRTAQDLSPGTGFNASGAGGLIRVFDWNGTVVWDYLYSDSLVRQHHDIERLPNGNVLLIAWELKTHSEAIEAGRSPYFLTDLELWPDHVVEVQPTGATGGVVVWEWHLWDHLIQDYDPARSNYGSVADHPERIDINYKATVGPNAYGADWTHTNAIDYNASLDQIILSVLGFSEIWVIDHSTTTAEAAGHSGGNSGRGGDLLYRWGNPEAYGRGTASDRKLFLQHDAQWIEDGRPGAGNMLVFNNGRGRPGGNLSSVDEIVPPVDLDGHYDLDPGAAYGPADPIWRYPEVLAGSFFARNISGAQRQPGGTTLICDGPAGTFLEVNQTGEPVWKYVNPINNLETVHQGTLAIRNSVFRIYRYGPDFPGLAGEDLTPGDPLELYTRPLAVPDGSAATDSLTGVRVTPAGDWIQVGWDATTCQATEYNLIYGRPADLSSYALLGSECAVGVTGSYDWTDVPAGDLFFLIVGVDETGLYESSWGTDSSGAERLSVGSSALCGVTTKDPVESCP